MAQYAEYGLENRVAVITGGGSGIGKATALEMAKAGAKVAIFGRRPAVIQEAQEECRQYTDPNNILALSVDVRDKAAVLDGVAKVLDLFGNIDILVNNAGIELPIETGKSRLWDYFDVQEPEEYLDFFRVNTMGHYIMNLAVIPTMQKNHFGRIVNVSSSLGVDGDYSIPSYTASKGAAITQTKAFARRYGKDNITVNAVLPGMTDTPMKVDVSDEERAFVLSQTLRGYIAQPIDIARIILFFAQENLFVTGQSLICSGGQNI